MMNVPNQKQRESVADTIARASSKFQMGDGTEAGSLVIENERLKTTIMVLTQKLQTQTHTGDEMEKFQKNDRHQKNEIAELKAKVSGLEAELTAKVSEYESRSKATVGLALFYFGLGPHCFMCR